MLRYLMGADYGCMRMIKKYEKGTSGFDKLLIARLINALFFFFLLFFKEVVNRKRQSFEVVKKKRKKAISNSI